MKRSFSNPRILCIFLNFPQFWKCISLWNPSRKSSILPKVVSQKYWEKKFAEAWGTYARSEMDVDETVLIHPRQTNIYVAGSKEFWGTFNCLKIPKMSLARDFYLPNCQWGEISVCRTVRWAKCPLGEQSVIPNAHGAKCPLKLFLNAAD